MDEKERTDAIGEEPEKNGSGEATNSWLADAVYSHFTGVPLKALDAFIAVCILALIAVIAVGVLKAKGII